MLLILKKRGGKSCIPDLRMTNDGLEYLAAGIIEEGVLKDLLHHLHAKTFHACLAFAASQERKLVSIRLP